MAEVQRIDVNRIPMFVGDEITPADLALLYPYLAAPLEREGVQITKGQETRKGYDTTNWGYAWYTQRLNDIIGPAHWRVLDGVVHEAEVAIGQMKGWEIVVSVSLEIGSYINGEWRTIASRSNYGTHVARSKGDALKGALTNAIKKTIAMLGPGWQAYAGVLDDDLYGPEGEPLGYFKTIQDARLAAAEAATAALQKRAGRAGNAKTDAAGSKGAAQGESSRPAEKPQPAAQKPQAPAETPQPDAPAPQQEAEQGDAAAPNQDEPFAASFTVTSRPHSGLNSQRKPYAMVSCRDAEGNVVRVVAMGERRDALMALKVGATLEGQFRAIQGKNNTTLYEWVA